MFVVCTATFVLAWFVLSGVLQLGDCYIGPRGAPCEAGKQAVPFNVARVMLPLYLAFVVATAWRWFKA